MKKLTLYILLFNFSIGAFSQSTSVFRIPTNNGNWAIKSSSTIKGSKYLLKKWTQGVIIFNDSLTSQKLPLLFDLESNKLLSTNDQTNTSKGIELPISRVNGFKIIDKNTNYSFIKVSPNNFTQPKSRYKFYKKVTPSANVIKEIKKYIYDYGAGNGITKKGKIYKTTETIYIKNSQNKYTEVKSLSKNRIIKVFGNKKKIKKYISSNNINIKKSTDLDKLVNYCRTL